MNGSNVGQQNYNSHCVYHTWLMLKITYGLLFVVAGADKFIGMITTWAKYISPLALQYIPLTPENIIIAVGIIEIAIGLLILFKCTKLGGYLAALWLLIIAANLVTIGFPYDVAVRDIVMAIGAIALGCLTCAKK